MQESLQYAAAGSSKFSTFSDLIGLFIDLINPLLYLMVGLGLLVFLKGLVVFISKAGDAKSHAEGRSLMIWGLVALFVMVSVIGILRLVHDELGFGTSVGIPLLPTNPQR